MCILLKLDHAKFGVSNLLFQKLAKENLWGVGSTLPDTGRVNHKIADFWYPNFGFKRSLLSLLN